MYKYEWLDLQFEADSERHTYIYETFLWQIYLLTKFLSEICREEVTEEIISSYFRFDV